MQNVVLLLTWLPNKFMLLFTGTSYLLVTLFCLLAYFHEGCRKVVFYAAVSLSDVVEMDSVV